MTTLYEEIYKIVRLIPAGRVATYGQIARIINRPRAARQVGYALAALNEEYKVPWQRVVNAKGQISSRTKHGYEDYQRVLLEDEGIQFNTKGQIDLSLYLWDSEIVDNKKCKPRLETKTI